MMHFIQTEKLDVIVFSKSIKAQTMWNAVRTPNDRLISEGIVENNLDCCSGGGVNHNVTKILRNMIHSSRGSVG